MSLYCSSLLPSNFLSQLPPSKHSLISPPPHKPSHLISSSYQNPNPPLLLSRRSLLFFLSTAPSIPNDQTTPPPPPPPPPPPLPDTTVTDRVFIDFRLCPTSFLPDRTLGDAAASTPCSESVPLGRVVLGLYGRLVPRTVANFKAMCATGSGYRGTLVHKILQGQYFAAGRQGRRDKSEVRPPVDLDGNIEAVDSRAFLLTHSRPGTLSLCLGENDDEDEIKLNPNYRNVEFLITTGPGPCPELDGRNIVFGTVLEGLDVVATIAAIPTYKPAERIRQFNDFAKFLGDDRAQIARAIWDKPLKTVYIGDCDAVRLG
ncbi:hypothetical protein AAC387_Pa03g0415 [Persea americana]